MAQSSDTRTLELQIRASTELLIRNLKTADVAVAQFRAKTDGQLAAIDGRFAALGGPISTLKSTLAGLATGAAAGLAGALGGAGLIALAKNGLAYASSLAEVAQQLGVTTDDLQRFRYAASQVGIEQETLDKGLGKLTQTMGKAQLGAKEPAKAFEALGISVASLSGKTAGDVIPRIADALGLIPDPAKRAAIEVALFGKAGQQLDTLLGSGRGQIDELTQAAQRLGLVLSADQIAHADDAADKLAAVKQVLEAKISGAVADNATSILQLADALLAVTDAASRFTAGVPSLNQQLRSVYGEVDAFTGLLSRQGILGRVLTGNSPFSKTPTGTSLLKDYDKTQTDQIRSRVTVGGGPLLSADAQALVRTRAGGRVSDFLAPSGPKGKSADQLAREAESKRQEAERNARAYTATEARARLDLGSSRADLSNDPDERASIERERVDIAKRARDDEIASDLSLKRITEAQADHLRNINAQTAESDKQVITARRAHDVSEAAFERQRAGLDDQTTLLDIYGRIAGTAAERREIEARILAIRQREERLALEHLRDDATRSPEERQGAVEALGRLPERQAAERQDLDQRNATPLQAFGRDLKNEAAGINEALESIEVQGLQSLGDGIADAITGARSLGDAFKGVANGIIADLIRIAVRQAILRPLAGAIGLGFADGGLVLGYADGGVISGPGGPRSDSILARVSAGEYIVNAAATRQHLPLIHAINHGHLPRFADGGPVLPRFSSPTLPPLTGRGSGGGGRTDLRIKVEASSEFNTKVVATSRAISEQTVAAYAPVLVEAARGRTITAAARPSLPGV